MSKSMMYEDVHKRSYPTPPTPNVPLTYRLRELDVILKSMMYDHVHRCYYPTNVSLTYRLR